MNTMSTHTRVREALASRGLSLSAIGRDLGVTRQRVATAIDDCGLERGRRIKAHVAYLLDRTVSELWPQSAEGRELS